MGGANYPFCGLAFGHAGLESRAIAYFPQAGGAGVETAMTATSMASQGHAGGAGAPEHVAILDADGRVIAFNDSWRAFAAQHGLNFNVGENYAQACDDACGGRAELGSALAAGIRAVIGGALPEFSAVLPASGADDPNGLRVRVHRVAGDGPGNIVVTQALVDPGSVALQSAADATDDSQEYHVEFSPTHALNSSATEICGRSLLQAISHELRTPLNAVIGFSHLLLREPLEERQLQKVRYVHEAGRTLLELVNNMLEYDNLERGECELLCEDFDVRSLVQEVVALAQPPAKDKHLVVRYVVCDDVPSIVRGDRHRLRQVLLNLVGNAVRFTVRGSVSVNVGTETAEQVHVRLLISVCDTGIGIAPEQQAHLFAPCSRTGASATPKRGGAGLGLALSRRLIELMGGHIKLFSAPGKGATFEIDPVFQHAIEGGATANCLHRLDDIERQGTLEAGGDLSRTVVDEETWRHQLEPIGRAVIEQDWRHVEALCNQLMEQASTQPRSAVADEALRLTLAARRGSALRAREAFQQLAHCVAVAEESIEHDTPVASD